MAHANCDLREVGTINMANRLAERYSGHIFTWNDIQDIITEQTDTSHSGRIQHVLDILDVTGRLHIIRNSDKRNYTAAYLKDDLFKIVSAEEPEPEFEIDEEPMTVSDDWSALLAEEERIAALIENASDAELGFETIESNEVPDIFISGGTVTINFYLSNKE